MPPPRRREIAVTAQMTMITAAITASTISAPVPELPAVGPGVVGEDGVTGEGAGVMGVGVGTAGGGVG
jgi:hypothetical protein